MIFFFVINNQEIVLQKIKIKIKIIFYQIFDNKRWYNGKREREKEREREGADSGWVGGHAGQQPKGKGQGGNKRGAGVK